jgi:predicted dehydrogenase
MRILIVGLGSIGIKHINSLRKISNDFEIYALRSNQNSKKIDGVIDVYEIRNLRINFDFAIISNPTELHGEFIKMLANEKINLFIEKPPLSSLLQADELLELITKKKINTYVACNLRFHPCLQFLKKYFISTPIKKINEVNVYFGSYLPDWRPNRDFRTIYSAIPELGGGVHLDLFHEIDYSYWLFGMPTKVNNIKRNVSTLNIRAFDSAYYNLQYESFNVNIVLNYYRRDAKRSIEILFEDETWTVDLLKCSIFSSKKDIIFNVDNFTLLQTYDSQMENYLKNLKNKKNIYSFDESLEVLKICLASE